MFLSKSFDNYLEKLIRIVLPVIFFLPFLISSEYYFPFITPRNFLFRILITFLLASYLFLWVRNKEKYKLFYNKVLIAYLSLALVMTVSSLINGDFFYSFWSNYERMEGLLGMYYLIAFLIIILGIYYRRKNWLELLRISAWTSFVMAFLALAQHNQINLLVESSGGARVSGTLGNPTYLSVYALFNMFFLLYLLLKNKYRAFKFELFAFYALDILLIIFEIKSSADGSLIKIFKNPALLTIFLVPQILINLQYYFYNSKKLLAKYSAYIYLGLAIILNFIAIFNTQTRGVLVGLFGALIAVALFLLFSKYVNKKLKLIISGILLLGILLVYSIFVFKNSSFVQENNTLQRVASISFDDATTKTRLLTWQLSLEGFKEKPILGWGEENFYRVFNKYFPVEIFEHSASRVWFDRPHNVFLQQLVHGGILGLLSYLAIFFFAFKNLFIHYRKSKDVKTISIFGGLLIAYLIQNFFVFDSLNSYIPMVLLLAITVFLSGHKKSLEEKVSRQSLLKPTILFLVVIIVGGFLNLAQINTNKSFIKQYRANAASGFDADRNNQLLATINNVYLGKFELRQVYSEFAGALTKDVNVPLSIKKSFIASADKELLASIEEQPDNVRHHSFLVNLYAAAAFINPDYAQKNIDLIKDKALKLSPNRTQLYYSLGGAYMIQQNHEQSLSYFWQAQELSPTVFGSYLNLFSTYLVINDIENAALVIQKMEENVIYLTAENYNQVANMYLRLDMIDEAEALFNTAVAKYPEDLRLLSSLILYYHQQSDQEKVDFYWEQINQLDVSLAENINVSLKLYK
jgi:tetratricopeptide (TPR) repeat protein